MKNKYFLQKKQAKRVDSISLTPVACIQASFNKRNNLMKWENISLHYEYTIFLRPVLINSLFWKMFILSLCSFINELYIKQNLNNNVEIFISYECVSLVSWLFDICKGVAEYWLVVFYGTYMVRTCLVFRLNKV